MRQVVQDLRSGKLEIEDVPAPTLLETSLLVVNEYSLISAGTERATVDMPHAALDVDTPEDLARLEAAPAQ